MELRVERIAKKASYTIGKLYIDDVYFCDTLEDADRGLSDSMSVDKIKEIKKPDITAIPTGTYKITLDVVSNKFGNRPFYKEVCNGKLPRLLNVKGFDGILMHTGNSDTDSSGCLLVGENKIKGQVINSQAVFRKLYPILKAAKDKGETITIKII
jgi:hypothetical protein